MNDPLFCVQCKQAVDASDVFCKTCGTDQRPPAQRLVTPLQANPPPMQERPASFAPPPMTPPYSSNPSNVAVPFPEVSWGWTFLGGSIYFFCKGWIKAGAVSLVIAILTGGLSWFIIPFFAQSFVEKMEGESFGTGGSTTNNIAALQQLADLHSKGIITDAEFQLKRTELLRRV